MPRYSTPSRLHPVSLSLRLSLFVACAALAGVLGSGCSGTTCADCGVGGEGGSSEGGGGSSASSSTSASSSSCESTQGTIEGTAYLFAAPGSPDSEVAPGARVVILSAPGATPLYGKADDTGHFSIPLDAGEWYVGGEHDTGCQTDEPVLIQLEACETEVLDVVLDVCFG